MEFKSSRVQAVCSLFIIVIVTRTFTLASFPSLNDEKKTETRYLLTVYSAISLVFFKVKYKNKIQNFNIKPDIIEIMIDRVTL